MFKNKSVQDFLQENASYYRDWYGSINFDTYDNDNLDNYDDVWDTWNLKIMPKISYFGYETLIRKEDPKLFYVQFIKDNKYKSYNVEISKDVLFTMHPTLDIENVVNLIQSKIQFKGV